ncbi:MAG: 50S ribosomal protein L29 [Deltaproteobacteria bacterium RIFOXYD12_FULL_57_12]|nr:MAG: 50S ribosomal protein L29 [Deltaproteobacteria bacterium RIFOXYD12_FULL_57_12]
MKAKEIFQKIKGMSQDELTAKERSLREDLFKLEFQHRVRRLENTSRLRAIRREIARVQTVQNTMKKN